jgi:hypothetical protein
MKNPIITYEVTEDEDYNVLLNGKNVAEVLLTENECKELIAEINIFVGEKGRNDFDFVEVKNDGDKLGIIVDIWKDDECFETCCFWFEDFIEDWN